MRLPVPKPTAVTLGAAAQGVGRNPASGVHRRSSMVNSAAESMSHRIFRPLQIVTFAFLALVIFAMLVSAGITLHELGQLRAAQARLQETHQFESTHLRVERRLTALASPAAKGSPSEMRQLAGDIDELLLLARDMSQETRDKLEAVRLKLQHLAPEARADLVQTITLFRESGVVADVDQVHLLADLQRRARAHLWLELAAPLAVLALGVVLLPIARRRIVKPLEAFGRQLTHLADGQFTPVPVDEVDPLVLPLHQTFNELAQRLQELEAAQRARTQSLENEVRAATQALLEQQQSLARAERLAATGELAATVAHDLRNPLAGIQMTLTNLRADLKDPELIERVDLMLSELQRLTRLLNELLDASRHAPEPARPVQLRGQVDETLSLLRYQIPANVRLAVDIDDQLTCRLPQDRLRQALLNLLLNAAAALAERGGTIRLAAQRDGQQVRITVTDDGPGFPEEMLQGGIRSFFSTRDRGTGLGLAMVRRFARDVGGELTLANCQPQGAVVTLVLPTETD